MLDKMFLRKDVCDFIEELFSDDSKLNKNIGSVYDCDMSWSEQALFTFFDALFKYQVIIDSDIFLDEYIIQVRKLFKKLNSFHDINLGISKIIGKLCALKFNIVNREDPVSKRQILLYVYNKYIVDGYFFHGFSSVYKDQIERFGFVPEQYQHSYSKFIEIDKIFNKHGMLSVMGKSFLENYSVFTDSFMMGCYYGVNSPMYFYKLLGGSLELKNSDREAYFKNDYLGCFNNLNMLIRKAKLNDYEKKYVTKVCCDEWKVLQRSSSKISVMLVKRSVLGLNCLRDINDILSNNNDLGDGIFKILNSKSNNIPVSCALRSSDIKFIEIPNYRSMYELREKQAYEIMARNRLERKSSERLSNTYGKVSVLVLLGSLFITLGVILSIISVIRGI